MEPQSQSQGGGQAQSRGAAGLTRYHRPLALRAEVSASPFLHFPSTCRTELTLAPPRAPPHSPSGKLKTYFLNRLNSEKSALASLQSTQPFLFGGELLGTLHSFFYKLQK